jgi:hypothetical protein
MPEAPVGTDLLQIIEIFPDGHVNILAQQVLVLAGGEILAPVQHPGRGMLFKSSNRFIQPGNILVGKVTDCCGGINPRGFRNYPGGSPSYPFDARNGILDRPAALKVRIHDTDKVLNLILSYNYSSLRMQNTSRSPGKSFSGTASQFVKYL